MSEQPSLRDRAAAVGVEIHELRKQAALAADVRTLVPLKEADRALKREFGRGESVPGDSYAELKERLADELYGRVAAEDLVIKERSERLHQIVRGQVERELADERAELETVAAELHDREANVAAREAGIPLLSRSLRSGRRGTGISPPTCSCEWRRSACRN